VTPKWQLKIEVTTEIIRATAIAAALLGLCTSVGFDAHADEPRDPRKPEGIEEITVTARKRDESLKDTPISITAFTASQMENAGIRRSEDLARFTPNLKFEQAPATQNNAAIQIRGVGNADAITTRDNGVGIYVDGIYLARAQGQLVGLADIERVEVLRGPQGTLFGRNTVGGAVNIITRKPDADAFESSASVRLGNYNLLETRASANIPLISERAAARFSMQTATRDGYTENQVNGQETDDRRLLGWRLALMATPTEDLELLFTGEQTRAHQAGRGGECRFNPAALGTAAFVQAQQLTGTGFVDECLANQGDGDEYEYRSPFRSKENLDTTGLSGTITWQLGELELKSLSSWQRQENESKFELTFINASVAPGMVDGDKDHNDQVSQELNLSGTALGGRLKFTGGMYAFYEKTTPNRYFAAASYNLCLLDPATLVFDPGFEDVLLTAFGLPLDVPLPAQLKQAVICSGTFITRGPKISTSALSGYGQLTYDLTPRLHLTGGLRYSSERKDFAFRQVNFNSPDEATATDAFAGGQLTDRERFGKWTPLVNLAFDVTPESNLYASYSRGFKSGGFNGRPNAQVPASLLPFDQEVLDSYEVGFKSTWLDNRLGANIAVFYNEYDDIQATILSASATGAFASRVANASQATIRGAEIELQAVPSPGFDVRLGMGFIDADLREFEDQVRGPIVNGVQTFIPIDRSGDEFYNTPRFSATLSTSYTFFDLASLGDLTLRVNWYHQEEVNYAPQSDTLKQGTYGLLSSQVVLALPDGKTELALFGENLLDRRYVGSGVNFEDGFALSDAYYGPPRMYGLEIRRTF
jgi:iron complex outermembrane recepter protein